MRDELYSKDDLLAFQRVGEFLCWFAMLETDLDESIIALLGLEPMTGRLLLSYIIFSRKCEFLGELTRLEEVALGDAEKEEAKTKIGQLHKKGQTRNLVAHSHFLPQEGAIKFMKANKSIKPDTSETIDAATFEKHRTEMVDLRGWIASISGKIRMKMTEKRIAQTLFNKFASKSLPWLDQ